MAQRTEKEETEFKVPETLTHCVNNCGVTGNPSTNNMCQKCFNASSATTTATSSSAVTLKFSGEKSPRSSSFSFEAPAEITRKTTASEIARSDESANRRVVNRCSGCRESYDYKAAGREAIARENPVVKAAKIVRV
ncbi:zinc finger A20 and AN1 domain-containing stress-associated protein 5 [Prunus yedoensis var. nudiflora]|uniref:Zinc finger A20 and AN1 domain-containing stress-associated protein 5 n=1 Tax=Prunus yedoensis var. nudiflora TaxID=2094558 RepID=A0A314USE6_PRUYE|nr:zinc finger A20 and AN1 domain-containing stress-associated protein 5 [Prunus yedoensis var. nudiflora]